MNKILQNSGLTLSSFIFFIGALFLACITYMNLDQGFIFNDEAYYLSYYKNQGESLSFDRTNFFRIFKFLYTPNIYIFRIISITALVLSNFLLFFSTLKYFDFKKNIFLLSFLGILIGFETWSISNLILQQYIGNTILVNCGVSLILLSFVYQKKWILTIAGFVISFILFNGNSHSIIVIPIMLYLFFQNPKQWKLVFLYFFIGFATGIIIYFTFLDTLDNFMDQLKFLKEYLPFHRKQHSKTFMVLWCVYLFLNGILPPLIIGLLFWKFKFKIEILDKIIAFIGVLCLALFIFFQTYYIFSFISFTHLLVLRFILDKEISKESKYLILLLLVIPYCLAFGSQTWFHIRLNAYKFYYFLIILVIINRLYKNKLWMLGYLIFICTMIIRFPDILHDKGWKDFVFTEQTEKVQINGYDLYLDKGRKKDIEDLRPYLQNQKDIIYSSNHLMGYLYILDASPPIYYYFTLKDYLSFIIKKMNKTPDDFIYIESDDYPFSPKEIIPLKFVHNPENYKIVKTGRFTLYIPSQRINKN
ncbi:hypothetical protein OF897_00145 [Chryseobacterium formosus]|uniref:Glycosyltransferase RgtA/B/C/D-like domain-containing protein n=1 Tax=Chryseobacterium formosus TaxID=1537363 RepID=A0ABT3XKX4_9FLAO|nr:hypothetical protein [Chryseobacterium formosus]MCX8522331.1 hypothetical protein [Chryseobacterium formosus]